MEQELTELAPVKYAREFYSVLEQTAVKEEVPDSQPLLVWRGKLTEVYRQLGSSAKYHTMIRAILMQTGSITIVEQGARNRDSTVVLNHPLPPPAELAPVLADLDLTGTRPAGTMWQEFERRIVALEKWRETTGGLNIADALRNFENRLTKLEVEREGNGKETQVTGKSRVKRK